jgi:asparagine synthetase B (glutamine-hydrolysing)
MCSFLFSRTRRRFDDALLEEANFFARKRGPDRTSVLRSEGTGGWQIILLHNLLDMSGNAVAQPLCSGGDGAKLWTLFNGEIYNFKDLAHVDTDTECLAPAFRRHGITLGRELDGEFAVALYDETANALYVFTDPFLTKPLYFGTSGVEGELGVATCASTLRALGLAQIELAQPNAAYQIRFHERGFEIERHERVWPFDLNQHKESYFDWARIFVRAVEKRAMHGAHEPMVFLSSGYDSGGICLALNSLAIPYSTYTICAGEEMQVLQKRLEINRAASCRKAVLVSGLSAADRARMQRDISESVEPFRYVHEDSPGQVIDIHDDSGAIGGNFIAGQARSGGELVNLSGSGADEIMSDYGFAGRKFCYHSQFGGLFPEDLAELFPWKKFYGDTQRSYLFKEEYILGRHGLEGRYPYLDKFLVQEFLWLTPKLKNLTYKAPLAALFQSSGYPFEPLRKRGFGPMIPQPLDASLSGGPPTVRVV